LGEVETNLRRPSQRSRRVTPARNQTSQTLGDVVELSRATPPGALAVALALLLGAYVGADLATTTAHEFRLGESLSSPTVATAFIAATAAVLWWSLGGGGRLLAVIAGLIAAERVLWIRNRLGLEPEGLQAALELAAAGALVVAAVWYCRRRHGPRPLAELAPRLEDLGRRVVDGAHLGWILAGTSLITLLVIVGGVVARGDPSVSDLELGRDRVDAWATGGLLAIAGLLAILRSRQAGTSRWWLAFGAVLTLMAIDEIHALHDHFEIETGVQAPLVAFPVGLAALVIWIAVLRTLPRGLPAGLVLAGGALWTIATGLDLVSIVATEELVEEAFEVAGSASLLAGIALELKASDDVRPSFGPPSLRPGSDRAHSGGWQR
jgi:hypothetical protein